MIAHNLRVFLSQKILGSNKQEFQLARVLFNNKITSLEGKISELNKKIDAYSAINAAYGKRIRTLEKALRRLEPPLENLDIAEAGARRVLTFEGVEFSFRYCPAGKFTMGSPADERGRDDDERQREVTIREGFWIFEYPTTQAQWDAVSGKYYKRRFTGERLPVENVSWHDSATFVNQLNALDLTPDGWVFALPTEEQWEYACRAGTTGSTFGVPLVDTAWFSDNSDNQTHEVGTKKPNAWGIYDMLGNVWEWTSSYYENGTSFVFRGGGWNNGAQFCRPARRNCDGPVYCEDFGFHDGLYDDVGFRVVLVPSKRKKRG